MVSMTSNVLGSPEVKWYKGREQINDSEDFRYENDGSTYRLVIAEVFPEDSGMYKCVAENEAGSASSCFTVFVEGTWEVIRLVFMAIYDKGGNFSGGDKSSRNSWCHTLSSCVFPIQYHGLMLHTMAMLNK